MPQFTIRAPRRLLNPSIAQRWSDERVLKQTTMTHLAGFQAIKTIEQFLHTVLVASRKLLAFGALPRLQSTRLSTRA